MARLQLHGYSFGIFNFGDIPTVNIEHQYSES